MASRFAVGDRVVLVADPSRHGVIGSEPQSIGSVRYYDVVFQEEAAFYAEDDLELVRSGREGPAAWLLEQDLADAGPFGQYYTLLKLRTRLSDHLYSYLSSRTIFRVYQFKPVLKLLSSPFQRLLIADEVGLGKTIEAGLIWSELDARMSLDRVLIVCPAGLRRKWQLEMERRFDREVPVAGSTRLLEELVLARFERQGERSRFAAIAGLETLRSRAVLARLREVNPTFDLVIVDEAHHMRNVGRLSYELGEFLSEAADALVFLTATPLNLGTADLFNLINLLVPEEYDSLALFDQLLEPNQYVNEALRILRDRFPPDAEAAIDRLRKVESTTVSARFERNPYYREALTALGDGVRSRRDVVELQRQLTELNTLAHVYTRTRKRDLKEKFAVRAARTLSVDWTDQEWAVYDAATSYVIARFRRLRESGAPLGFVAIMPQRQAASCLPVMRDYLLEALTKRGLETDFEEGEEDTFDQTRVSLGSDSEVRAMQEALDATKKLGATDTKYDRFTRELRKIYRTEPGARILVFSFFRRTLAYLRGRLEADGFAVRQMDGGTKREDRESIIDSFRRDEFQILLSSEVGAEGLDFEFCRFLFNYDLPWNPMRLEQRIGRLDRFGQLHDKIAIVNFRIDGTIESDIFERLYDRIGIFRASIGELEPILGDAIKKLEKTLLSPDLSPAEQRARAEEIAQAVENQKAALEQFEETKARLVGNDDYVVEQLDGIEAARRYITPEELQRLFEGFLEREVGGRSSLRPDPTDGRLFQLRASGRISDLLRHHLEKYGPEALALLSIIEVGGVFPVTFHPEVAYQRQAHFLNLRHPLIKAIVDYYEADGGRLYRAGAIEIASDDDGIEGDYLFFIFVLEASGLVPQRQLHAVAVDMESHQVDERASEQILPALAGATLHDPPRRPVMDPEVVDACFDAARHEAFSHEQKVRADLLRTNEAIAVARQESLRESLRLRETKIEELLENVTDARIQRMRQSQLANLRTRISAKLEDIERRKQVSVGVQHLAGGYARIVRRSA